MKEKCDLEKIRDGIRELFHEISWCEIVHKDDYLAEIYYETDWVFRDDDFFNQLSDPKWDFRDKIDAQLASERLYKALDTITDRERYVLIETVIKGKSFEKVASEKNVSNSRIQQIQAKGIRKLRHPTRISIIFEKQLIDSRHQHREAEYQKAEQEKRDCLRSQQAMNKKIELEQEGIRQEFIRTKNIKKVGETYVWDATNKKRKYLTKDGKYE